MSTDKPSLVSRDAAVVIRPWTGIERTGSDRRGVGMHRHRRERQHLSRLHLRILRQPGRSLPPEHRRGGDRAAQQGDPGLGPPPHPAAGRARRANDRRGAGLDRADLLHHRRLGVQRERGQDGPAGRRQDRPALRRQLVPRSNRRGAGRLLGAQVPGDVGPPRRGGHPAVLSNPGPVLLPVSQGRRLRDPVSRRCRGDGRRAPRDGRAAGRAGPGGRRGDPAGEVVGATRRHSQAARSALDPRRDPDGDGPEPAPCSPSSTTVSSRTS